VRKFCQNYLIRGVALCLSPALEGVVGQRHDPPALPPEKRHGTYFSGGWVGLHFRSGRVRKIYTLPEFDPRNACPIASRFIEMTSKKSLYQTLQLKHYSAYFK